MKTNTLKAIVNIIKNNINDLEEYKSLNYKIRINNTGEALENLIKNSLCNSYNSNDIEKINLQNKYFSYLGNQNNPPDLIIKNGDAVEVKKNKNFSISDVSIKSPNNPANLLDATLISFGIKT